MSAMNTKEKKRYITRMNQKNKLKKNKHDSESDEDIWSSESESEEDIGSSDSSYRPPKAKSKSKSKPKPKSNKKTNKKTNRVVEIDSDDEDDDDDEDEDEYDDDEDDDDDDEEEEEEDEEELQEFQSNFHTLLANMFPSKYSSEKAKSSRMNNKNKSKTKHKFTKSKKNNKKRRESSDEEEEESDEDDYDDDEDDDSEPGQYNIIFTSGDGGYDDDDEDVLEDDEDEECNSDDEKTFMKEKYENVEIDTQPDSSIGLITEGTDAVISTTTKKETGKGMKGGKRGKGGKGEKRNTNKEVDEMADMESEYVELIEMKKNLISQLKSKPKSKILKHAITDCNNSIHKLILKTRHTNVKKYHELINGEQKHTGELEYFKKKLSNKEQLKIMRELTEINSHIHIDKPYRLTLLESNIPAKYKATVMQKLNVLRSMDQGDPEYYKIKNWVDTFMRVPFGRYKGLSVNMSEGIDVCSKFMCEAKNTLDNCVYGLDDAKLQILQMVGQWISNPSAMGTSIAIKGPMGTGKTTLVKEGISQILGREFAFIALGGAGDSSFLEGHSYTYEGSSWGKIVQFLIDSKCMNPVIYFDELDKISDTPRGEEIIGILTHLTDTTQNSQFHDKYFSEIDFDLSKCLFIFSYNDESKVNAILKDRMYRIQTKGYDMKEKVIIARKYLLPKIREQVNFQEEDIIIPDETLQYIISNTALTQEEAGVRNLKRCLEIIHTKLNLFRLVHSDHSIFSKDINLKVSFPMTVSKMDVDVLIKNEEKQNQSLLAMYI